MNPQTVQATFGCLLHDVGKAVYRAGISDGRHGEAGYRFVRDIDGYGQAKAVLDCIRYHHAAQLRQAKDCDPLAAIACIADNIAAAADRRQTGDETQFDRYLPLSPVFTHLNGEHPGHTLPPHALDGCLRLPLDGSFRLSAGDYEQILLTLRRELSALPPQEEWLNSLLSVWESCMSTVPSSTNTGESPDISLYDHSKVTAAVGACISEYLLDRGETDYFTALVQQEQSFRLQQAFLLYSADFSGIQKFIYSVSTRNALKSLRSRSFFLELCMEHYIDELLQLCGLSRANLLYSGGGYCYVLLPNTEKAVRTIQAWNTRFNDFLIEQFGVRLYLADGYTPCSANDLTNTPAEEAPYQAMFRRVSRQVAKKKLHRYSVQQLRRMNQSHQDPGQRECRICGRTDALRDGEEDTCICLWCALFESLSRKIQGQDVYVVSRDAAGADFALPAAQGELSFILTNEARARQLLAGEGVARVYTKNRFCAGLRYSTRIYVGDYAASNSMDELAQQAAGVRRIAVCRMDVDNLGHAFISGFEQENEKDPVRRMRYVNLSRTSAFSRQMSLFFKGYINGILEGLQVSIVYAGGDDVFLVGAWNDVLEAAQRIQRNLTAFSCGALTLSAGIGIFDPHYPIRLSAEETAALEEAAKHLPGKNAVALFTPERKAVRDAKGNLLVQPEQGHTYAWDTFRTKVLEEKVGCLQRFFQAYDRSCADKGETPRGNSMLYNLLALLREAENDRINLARYAYLLARLSPKKNAPDYKLYEQFSHSMMDWALDAVQRHQLITAIYIYVYQNRKGGDTDGRME